MKFQVLAIVLSLSFVQAAQGDDHATLPKASQVAGDSATAAAAPAKAPSDEDEFADLGLLYGKGKSFALSEVDGKDKDSDQKMDCYLYSFETEKVTKVYAYAHFFGEFPRKGSLFGNEESESDYDREDRAKKLGFDLSHFKTAAERDGTDIKEARNKAVNVLLPFLRKEQPVKDGALTYSQGFGAGSVGFSSWRYSVKKVENPKTGQEQRIVKFQAVHTGPRSYKEEVRAEMYCM